MIKGKSIHFNEERPGDIWVYCRIISLGRTNHTTDWSQVTCTRCLRKHVREEAKKVSIKPT